MGSLAQLYQITPDNLAQRRRFIGLDGDVVALLRAVAPWADEVADEVARELAAHHFEFPAAAEFFRNHAAQAGIELAELRAGWQAAQAAHWRAIFAEPDGSDPFGADYFAALLGVGALHNKIDVPLKWYLGSYPAYMDAVRRALREHPPVLESELGARRPPRHRRDQTPDHELAADVERALAIVFNYDVQGITASFYFDTFANLGVDLAQIRATGPGRDLGDHAAELKTAAREPLELLIDSSRSMHDLFAKVRGNVNETATAIEGIATASAEVARGSERQAEMLLHNRELSDEVTEATARAREVGVAGAEAVSSANEVMARVRGSGQEAQAAIQELAQKSSEIGGILDTIAGIAGQTNLLALNAA
ncbi:MAG: protoglobin domain-containing protein, partial [Solirubrobacteraceae bacterium]